MERPQFQFDSPDLFSFEDCFPGLHYLQKHEPGMVARARATFEDNRSFCQTHVRPLALSSDRRLQAHPDEVATELLQLAIKHRRFSRFVPTVFGGLGDGTAVGPMIAAEEIAAVDPGFVGVLSGHGLGMVALMLTANVRLIDWFSRRTVESESGGRPFLIDCAITEPGAGTDMEETALMPHAQMVSEAKRVPGGAVLNGRKCFISGGHFATHHLVILPFDRSDPVGTGSLFVVPTDSEGFSLGKLENKMGQKSGPASELVLEDCFVPDDMIAIDGAAFDESIVGALLDGVLGATRVYVGAWATGAARGAFETALQFAKTHHVRGERVIDQQWAQEALTNMMMNVHRARATYMEALFALMGAAGGGGAPGFINSTWFSAIYRSYPVSVVRQSEFVRRALIRKRVQEQGATGQRVQFYSSLAKVSCSDLAMETCHLAIEMMGAAGVRHEAGAEKLFRDAKLCQIFEGTNQLNRLHMFNQFVARDVPGLEVF